MNLWALIWSWWMNRFMLYIFYEENWSQPTLRCRRCHHQDSWSQQTLWCEMFGLGAPQISKPAQIMKWHATGFLRKSHPTVWVFFSPESTWLVIIITMNSLLSATIFICTLSIDNYFFNPFEAVCFNPFQLKMPGNTRSWETSTRDQNWDF